MKAHFVKFVLWITSQFDTFKLGVKLSIKLCWLWVCYNQNFLRSFLQAHQKVIQKLKDIIKSWAEGDFKSDPALEYDDLRDLFFNFDRCLAKH